MSLKVRFGKLKIEDQRAAAREVEPGPDSGILEASEEVHFEGAKREEIYGWVSQTLQIHSYGKRNRVERGLLRSYIAKPTGLGRAHLTRRIVRYLEDGELRTPRHRASGGGG